MISTAPHPPLWLPDQLVRSLSEVGAGLWVNVPQHLVTGHSKENVFRPFGLGMGAVRIGRVKHTRGRPESYLLATQPSGLVFQDIEACLAQDAQVLPFWNLLEPGGRDGARAERRSGVPRARRAGISLCKQLMEKRQCCVEGFLAPCRSPGESPGSDLLWPFLCVAAIGRGTLWGRS